MIPCVLPSYSQWTYPKHISPSYISYLPYLQVKDHSNTGKDQHLGSYAIRIKDIQEGKKIKNPNHISRSPNLVFRIPPCLPG